ncbi:hypothetical protein FOMPIDRAFT_1015641 [Fomitopsis schrenkii]|uniref:Uncharacterized protein n=1 Tax=Fomitopsis schrenkii TaxID=2126942 RepID=S8EA04_FOMSC|nr:hypothetical protein FOMPIDRAFT_1015641 [Fomitopsis schrenkii]
MVLSALGTVALALASATPGGYMYCKAGGWGNRHCPGIVNSYERVANHVQHYMFTGEWDLPPEIWYVPEGYFGPEEKWEHDQRIRGYIRHIQWELRVWALTKDLMVPPSYELADWTKNLVVIPPSGPGELIVWKPRRTGLPWELAHTLFPPNGPSPVYDPVYDSTTAPQLEPPVPAATKAATLATSLDTLVYDSSAASSLAGTLHTVIAFYTLVIGFIAAGALTLVEPARQAWRSSVLGHIGVLAMLGFVWRAIYGSMLLVTALTGIPSDDAIQQAASAIGTSQQTGSLPRRLARSLRVVRNHALIGGPRPLVAYDLANWTPRPAKLAQRTSVTVFHDTPVPTVLVVARPAARSRTFSSMTVMEARSSAVPHRGLRTMASDVEETQDAGLMTLYGAKKLLRRQAPGVSVLGLWKRRAQRHEELRALRDEMGEEVALRHAQEAHAVLRANLRSMMGFGEQVTP